MNTRDPKFLACLIGVSLLVAGCGGSNPEPAPVAPPPTLGTLKSIAIPTGQVITPTAAPSSTFSALNPGLKDFPNYTAGQAISEVLSADQKTLLVLTSGYNINSDAQGKPVAAASNE